MFRCKKYIPIIALCCIWLHTIGQEEEIQNQLAFILQQETKENQDLSIYYDLYLNYFNHPIDVNGDQLYILNELFQIDLKCIENIRNHIKDFGKITDLLELQIIPCLDPESFQRIKPFISIEPQTNSSSSSGSMLIRNSINTLNDNNHFTGRSNKFFAGITHEKNTKYKFRIAVEKDEGETFGRIEGLKKWGPDFNSAHLQLYTNKKRLRDIILGDFLFTSGQGLTYWNGMSFGKTTNLTTLCKNSKIIRPYSSLDENNFLRGIAIEMKHRNWKWFPFFSYHMIDANITENRISSLLTSGLHRDSNSLMDRKSTSSLTCGSHVSYKLKKIQLGITNILQRYPIAFENSTKLYQHYNRLGAQHLANGIDFKIHRNKGLIFGEITSNNFSRPAWILGGLFALNKKINLGIVYRDYPRNFIPLVSSAFGEATLNQNEKGIFAGIDITISKQVKLFGYFDQFKFDWLKYQINSSQSTGNDKVLMIQFKPSKLRNVYILYSQKQKALNEPDSEKKIIRAENYLKWNIRIQWEEKIEKTWTLRVRVEKCQYNHYSNVFNGILIANDFIYNKMLSPWTFSIRIALFETDDFKARIYAYENNISNSFSIPFYYGKGSRVYGNIKFKPTPNLHLGLRLAKWSKTEPLSYYSPNKENWQIIFQIAYKW